MNEIDLRHRRFLQVAPREHTRPFARISAGRLLKIMDDTAGKAANIYAGSICMTRAIERIDFKHPIRSDDAIDIETWVVRTGNTSLDVEITVRGRDHHTHEIYEATRGLFTMVNVKRSFTGEFKAAPVPKLPASLDPIELEKRRDWVFKQVPLTPNPSPEGEGYALAVSVKEKLPPYEPYFGQEHRNHLGSVHGGNVLMEIDHVAHHYAMWMTQHPLFVTAAFGSVEFRKPILPSMLVTMEPLVEHVGSTSIGIGVNVFVQSHEQPEKTLSHKGKVWLVAFDEQERKCKLPIKSD